MQPVMEMKRSQDRAKRAGLATKHEEQVAKPLGNNGKQVKKLAKMAHSRHIYTCKTRLRTAEGRNSKAGC